jgi:hypothetical protein
VVRRLLIPAPQKPVQRLGRQTGRRLDFVYEALPGVLELELTRAIACGYECRALDWARSRAKNAQF